MNMSSVNVWGRLNWPNRISVLRLMLVVPFVVLLLNLHDPAAAWSRYAALGIFVVMAFSDFLDGLLARRYNLRTRLGAFLDPLADKIIIVCSVVLLSIPALAPREFHIPAYVAAAVVGKDLWVAIGSLVMYRVTGKLTIRPSRLGKLSTAVQLTTVICVLLVPDLERLRAGLGVHIAWGLTIATFVVSLLAILGYTRTGLDRVFNARGANGRSVRGRQASSQ
ncbi:MAG: CDP-alcohol phosphatidyltransferase family protein [Phycisphaerae bacterium]|nr:CDP-alcohol phosphatidyltransferase family protein [Phycisphaerae bacterium]